MFAFLFRWTDANWLKRRKPKMFRFTPSPVSSASVFWWTGLNGFSTRGAILDPTVARWFDKRFPPLALYQCVAVWSTRLTVSAAARTTLVRSSSRSPG